MPIAPVQIIYHYTSSTSPSNSEARSATTRRGRGWQVWGYPVGLEPPLRLFLSHFAAPPALPFDDGRKPAPLSAPLGRTPWPAIE